jgi:hypothetical protein
LTTKERAILDALIPEDGFPDTDVYRAQLDHVTVVGRCACGCPTIYLRVDDSARRAEHRGDPDLPLWGTAGDPADRDGVVDVAVWAPDGTLTELNVSWYGERPPAALPDVGELIVGPGPEPIRGSTEQPGGAG